MFHADGPENKWKSSHPKDVRIFSCSVKIKLEFKSGERRARTKVVEWMMIKVFWLAGEGKSFTVNVVWECMVAQYVQHSWFPSAPSLFSSVRNLGRAHSKERNNASSSCKWSAVVVGVRTRGVVRVIKLKVPCSDHQPLSGPRTTGFPDRSSVFVLSRPFSCYWRWIEVEAGGVWVTLPHNFWCFHRTVFVAAAFAAVRCK